MNSVKILLTVVLLALLSACASTGKVFSDFDPEQRFDGYKKFSWTSAQPGEISGTYPVSALSKSKMTKSIQAELEERGFTFVETKVDADFLVSFTLGARDQIGTRIEREYQVDPYAWRWGRGYYPHYFSEVIPVSKKVPYQFTEGSIALDIFDAADNRPVWHSSASKRLNSKELAGSQSKQRETAKALLEGFPPQ